MIDLYSANTPNGKKISIMLEEIGFDYKVIIVDINNGEQYKDEFKKISPLSKIPAITDHKNKVSLFQSGAILIYLAKFKKSNFQIAIDSIYDNDWDYKAINYIYGINIYDNVFLNMGLIQNLSNNNFDGLLTLNFNI